VLVDGSGFYTSIRHLGARMFRPKGRYPGGEDHLLMVAPPVLETLDTKFVGT
jgi:hypothetical protein